MTQPWTDIALFFGTIIGLIIIGTIIYLLERLPGCWHKWGTWDVEETPDVYVQARKCNKCGYTEIQQLEKVRT
jgi:hypothetical protein